MTDHVFITSPFGTLAFTPGEISAASARANELAVAMGLTPPATSTPPPAEGTATWLSVDEVADRTNLKKSWIYQEIRANRIPNRHFGKQVRIPASYLAAPDIKSGSKQPGGQ